MNIEPKYELQTLADYSDESLIAEIHRVTGLLENGERLTIDKFNKLSRTHCTTLANRFGSWQKALDRAGISENVAPRVKYISKEELFKELEKHKIEHPDTPVSIKEIANRLGISRDSITRKYGKWINILAEVGIKPVPLGRRYTDEECYENIMKLWAHYGRQPHFAELKRPPSSVGSKAYELRWGGWRAALSAFIEYVNQPQHKNSPEETEIQSIDKAKGQPLPVSRSISLSLRYMILCRDKFRCVICGRSPAKDINIELHVDHVIPWSKGGQNTEENLRTLCFDCNLGKGKKIEIP